MHVTLISLCPDTWAPGPRLLSSCLKRDGHDVSLIFLQNEMLKKYSEKVLDGVLEVSKDSDLVGISLMTNFWDNAVQVAQHLKKNSDTPVIMGGVHPTIRPDECLEHADIVCFGEGEVTMTELVNKMASGTDYYDIPGLWFKVNGEIKKNPTRSVIQDLDALPFQDYDNSNHYIQSNDRVGKMDEDLLKGGMIGSYFPVYSYLTLPSRGCPFMCTYCCNNTLNSLDPSQRKIRKRSPENLIAELKNTKEQMPFVELIYFDDDAFFNYSIKEITDFSRLYKEEIGLPLSIGGVTPVTLTREKLLPLVEAGLKYLRMGIETGNERTLELYQRSMSNQKVIEAVTTINEFKDQITPNYDIILDNPWETEEDSIETLKFLSKLPTPYILNLYSLVFYPETELYRKAKKEGLITNDHDDVYRKYYYGVNKSYINNLFYLLGYYTHKRNGMSPKIMSLLTNQKIRQMGLHQIFYFVLNWRKYTRRAVEAIFPAPKTQHHMPYQPHQQV